MKALTILAAFLLMTTASFAQNGASVDDFEVFGLFYNPCCDELVEVMGTAQLVFRNGFGNLNNSNLVLKGASGTTAGGRTYTQRGASTQNIEVKDDGSGVATFQVHFVAPDGCSFSVRMVQKFTFNANGELVNEIVSSETTCD
ncbi:hypothetical protein KQI65_03900 [bacterium]|nr:hypothetical protein [bacterium]